MGVPTTITKDLAKVWIDFDHEWDDDIPMAMANVATIEPLNGESYDIDYDGLCDLLGNQEVERLEAIEAETMNYAEYMADSGDYYEDR